MNPFRFKRTKEEDLHVFHYLASEEQVVERSFPSDEPSWWNQWDFRPADRYNISGLTSVNNGIYLTLIWHLMRNLEVFAIPTWQRDEAIEILEKEASLVRWEYSVEEPHKWGIFCDRGFVAARSSPGSLGPDSEPLDPWKATHTQLAGLFPIDSFQEFVDAQRSGLTDAASQMNYFAIEKNHLTLEGIVSSLNSEEEPNLSELLGFGGIFANLYIGIDQGYCNSLLIKSKGDIAQEIERLSETFEARAKQFEEDLAHIQTMDEYMSALEELLTI